MADRIRLLVGELAAFFERSEPWYRISQREASDVGIWADAEVRY